jgi:tetratricopeptide (TPR) repeat protein
MEQQAQLHFHQGFAAMKAGDVDTAITEFEESTRLSQADYKVFNYLGAAYATKGLLEKAIGAFKRAEQIAPGVAKTHYNIAQAYEAAGILTEAEYEYEKALDIDPFYQKATDAWNALKAKLNK